MNLNKEIVLVVEDELSEAVMRKVIAHCSSSLAVGSRVIRSGGFGNIKAGLPKYKAASRVFPHVVLTDLDQHVCPLALLTSWRVGRLPSSMLLRIAVRSVESWLLADQECMADYLSIPKKKISQAPESLPDSKRELLSLVRRGRRRRLASEMCPEPGSVARQGPLYNAHMVRFVRDSWRVDVAALSAQSLSRTCRRIGELEQTLGDER